MDYLKPMVCPASTVALGQTFRRRVNGEDFIGVPQRNDGFVDVKKKENDEDSDSDEAFKIKTAKVDTEDIVSDSE